MEDVYFSIQNAKRKDVRDRYRNSAVIERKDIELLNMDAYDNFCQKGKF
jgi:hypothetical protein